MSVARLQHMSDFYVAYRYDDKLKRKVGLCALLPTPLLFMRHLAMQDIKFL